MRTLSRPRVSDFFVKPAPVVTWRWPVQSPYLRVYDKDSDSETTVSEDDETWVLPIQGRRRVLRFFLGPDGRLQRKLVILAHAASSPIALAQFAGCLVNNWPLYVELLVGGPHQVKELWTQRVNEITVAKTGKTLLKLAAEASVGSWSPVVLPLVKSLGTCAPWHPPVRSSRDRLLTPQKQAEVVRVLDEAVEALEQLTSTDLEGIVALALAFQHGVRGVQLLCVRTEQVRVLRDVAGTAVCIVSFHAAKQRSGRRAFEIVRTVRTEWTPLVVSLHKRATTEGRVRLFAAPNRDCLLRYVTSACKQFGLEVDFTFNTLRHSSAQALANAGHDRLSLKHFLGHSSKNAASYYYESSMQQSERINEALGISKLYKNVIALAQRRFVSVQEMLQAEADTQVGGVVGGRLVAGIGLCQSGQSRCPFNPVTSCYGCSKFLPSLSREAHEEAVAGMREQIEPFLPDGMTAQSPAYRQLMGALAGAQGALAMVDRLKRSSA